MTSVLLQRLKAVPFGARCLAGLLLGIIASFFVPTYCCYWEPLGTIFIRASQIVTMPFIMLELVCALGGLSSASLNTLIRTGGLVFLLLVVIGGIAVMFVPTWLPPLTSSSFFSPTILEQAPEVDLLQKFLPYNIFAAMAEDNFPAVVLFSAFAGLVLQRIKGNEILLIPLNSGRELFRKLNKVVLKLTPFAVFALVSNTLVHADKDELIRLHALPVIGLTGTLLLSVAVIGLTMSFSVLTWKELWSIIRAPLILTASAANLIISLPILITSLQEVLGEKFKGRGRELVGACDEQIGAAVPVGFALPTLGQVYMLILIPFMGWYADRPFSFFQKLKMLATGVPGSIGGIRSVVRQELAEASLPENLLNILFLNTEWIYRAEKTLSLVGLIALVLCIVGVTTGTLRVRIRRLVVTVLISGLFAVGTAFGVHAMLSNTLAGTYRKDQILLSRALLIPKTSRAVSFVRIMSVEEIASSNFPELPVTLDSIRLRKKIRIGLKTSDYPWSYRGPDKVLRGYDVDLIQTIANFSSLQVQVVEAPLDVLEYMISHQQLDIALGGIEENAYRSARIHTSNGYQAVHKALITWHQSVSSVQSAEINRPRQPLRIAVADDYMPSPEQRDVIEDALGAPGPSVPVNFIRIPSIGYYFSKGATAAYDALLWNAEGGSSWSVVYPQTDVLTVFGSQLPNQVVMLVGGNDINWHRYLDEWIAIQTSEKLFDRLYHHWILMSE